MAEAFAYQPLANNFVRLRTILRGAEPPVCQFEDAPDYDMPQSCEVAYYDIKHFWSGRLSILRFERIGGQYTFHKRYPQAKEILQVLWESYFGQGPLGTIPADIFCVLRIIEMSSQ